MAESVDHQEEIMPDYVGMLRRRKWYLILLIPPFAAAAVLVALLLDPIYRSTGTILVETQHIPQDLVRSTVTTLASERIQVIKQRVMTREKLLEVVDKYNLFAEEKDSMPGSVLLDQLRRNIFVDIITAQNVSRHSNSGTIAFTVAFEDEQPQIAQAVANDLVSLFLSENVKH